MMTNCVRSQTREMIFFSDGSDKRWATQPVCAFRRKSFPSGRPKRENDFGADPKSNVTNRNLALPSMNIILAGPVDYTIPYRSLLSRIG